VNAVNVYSENDIKRAVTMKDAIDVVRKAFVHLSDGRAEVPTRVQLDVPGHNGTTLFMPGYLTEDDQIAIKIVSVFGNNASLGLPMINALVVAVDSKTGRPVGVMNGTYLTALRTGAAAGVATDLLARPDVASAAIFGAGVQGRTQLEAVCAVRNLTDAWVFDTRRDAAEAFAREMEDRVPATIHVASDATEAASAADVICTVTTSATPVFPDSAVRPGAHINAVGVFKTHMQEITAETVVRSSVFVDSMAAAMEEAGDLVVPIQRGLITWDHVKGEIGSVAGGRCAGRASAEEVTLFKSVGVAVQDVAVAFVVIERAAALGLGVSVDL
jgi:alanine dehydrogenase